MKCTQSNKRTRWMTGKKKRAKSFDTFPKKKSRKLQFFDDPMRGEYKETASPRSERSAAERGAKLGNSLPKPSPPMCPNVKPGEMPAHWEPMQGKPLISVELPQWSAEYNFVMEYFKASAVIADPSPQFVVKRVIRVQNTALWFRYNCRRFQIIRELAQAGKNPEDAECAIHLFHGTSRSGIDGICLTGFDPAKSLESQRSRLGKGSYFAASTAYSCHYNSRTKAKAADKAKDWRDHPVPSVVSDAASPSRCLVEFGDFLMDNGALFPQLLDTWTKGNNDQQDLVVHVHVDLMRRFVHRQGELQCLVSRSPGLRQVLATTAATSTAKLCSLPQVDAYPCQLPYPQSTLPAGSHVDQRSAGTLQSEDKNKRQDPLPLHHQSSEQQQQQCGMPPTQHHHHHQQQQQQQQPEQQQQSHQPQQQQQQLQQQQQQQQPEQQQQQQEQLFNLLLQQQPQQQLQLLHQHLLQTPPLHHHQQNPRHQLSNSRVVSHLFSRQQPYTPFPSSLLQHPEQEGPARPHHYMILAKVLTGHTCLGKADYTEGPVFAQTPHRVFTAHACVDDVEKPLIFIIFDGAHAYPEYVVEYCKVKTH